MRDSVSLAFSSVMTSVSKEKNDNTQSETKEERVAVRRSRVRTKIEEARRQALGIKPDTPTQELSDPEKERQSSQQVAKSKQRVEKLAFDGTQLVTNVTVASDAREVTRRRDEFEARRARCEKLEGEANVGAERFEEIMRKWLQSKEKKIPQDLQELLQQQKKSCDQMLDEKDRLIAEFQDELKAQDEQYVKDLKKQAEDVDLLVERMEEQASSLVHAFQEEITEIDRSFAVERQVLMQQYQKEFDEAMQKRSESEMKFMSVREQRLEENKAKLQHLRVRNAEEFSLAKIKLETDIQNLQQQIQQMKATFQLNSEKLEYNFQVLKKRDEENTLTISQQKRRLTRLQDTLNNFRAKLAKQERTNHSELEALMMEYRKNVQQYKELQHKFKHFQLVDVRRFYAIWQMNEENVRTLASEVSSVDEMVYNHQLGLDWVSPPDIGSPLKPYLSKFEPEMSQATMYASQILSDTTLVQQREPSDMLEAIPISYSLPVPPMMVRQVLELLSRESSFLIESKLARLLAPLETEEQLLMKLDSIFKALHVESEDDVQELVRLFVRKESESQEKPYLEQESAEEPLPLTMKLIHPNDVTRIIQQFSESRQDKGSSVTSSHVKTASLHKNAMTQELLDGGFWEQMASILSQSHERVWSALLEGLEHYHAVLMSRAELIDKTESLQQQNAELRLLLHQYMHSKVNQELHIPPSLIPVSGNPAP